MIFPMIALSPDIYYWRFEVKHAYFITTIFKSMRDIVHMPQNDMILSTGDASVIPLGVSICLRKTREARVGVMRFGGLSPPVSVFCVINLGRVKSSCKNVSETVSIQTGLNFAAHCYSKWQLQELRLGVVVWLISRPPMIKVQPSGSAIAYID